ncbi:MAG: tetratricopeptide repeat protein [Planctomycetota bacterium]
MRIALVLVAAILAYANTFEAGFHFDDTHSIVANESIRDVGNVPAFFSDPGHFSSLPNHRMYRPVLLATYAFNHSLGGYDPFWWRLTAIALHALTAAGVFFLVRSLSATLDQGAGNAGERGALVAALIFAVHPVFTETVDYASARSSLLATACVVWALFAHRTIERRAVAIPVSLLLFTLGFLSKEIAIVFPILLALLAWLEKKDWRWVLPSVGVAIALLVLRKLVLGSAVIDFIARESNIARAKEGTGAARPTLWNIWTQSRVVMAYVALLFMPVGLCIHRHVRVSESFLEIGVVAAFALLASLLTVAWRNRRTRPMLAFGILWFLFALAPTSSIIPLNQVMNEHRMYLPGVGAAIVLGFAVPRLSFVTTPVWAAVIVFLCVLTWQRNHDWNDSVRIWESAVEVSPESGGSWNSLGFELNRRGDQAGARRAFERALAIKPTWEASLNLGTLCLSIARKQPGTDILNEAERHILASIEIDRGAPRSHWYLATVWYRQGRLEEAEDKFRRLAGKNRELYEMSRFPLARIALDRGDEEQARRLYNEALGHAYDPEAARALLADLDKKAAAK